MERRHLCICVFFFFNDTATTEIYTLSLHDALPILPIGPTLPMSSFMLSPDRKRGYSVMPKIGTGGNRESEWWVWDLQNHKVIKKKSLDARPTGTRFAVSSDGKKLYFYGNATVEIFDAETLESSK